MSMKAIIETEAELNALPEALRGEYKKNGEGKWVPDIEGGLVTKAQLDEMRNNNLRYLKERDDAKKELEKYANVNLDDYTRLKGIESDLTDQKLVKREGLDALVTKKAQEMSDQMKKELEGKLAAATATNAELNEKLANLTIDQEARKKAEELGVRPQAMEFVVQDIRLRTKMENGKPVLYKKDGTKDYNSETKEKSIAEAVEELVTANGFLLEANQGGGSSNQQRQGGGEFRTGETNPWKTGDTFNLTRQMEIVKANPQKAAAMRKEAGLTR